MIKARLRKFKAKLKLWNQHYKLEKAFARKHSSIGKSIDLLNIQYVRVGENVRIKDYNRICCYDQWRGTKLAPKVEIGEGGIINFHFAIFCTCNVLIGKNVLIASNVLITTENHGMNPECGERYAEQELISSDIIIGDNCWIGQNVCIVPGGGLGDNCIVAANAVVNKKFPSNVMVGGTPARVLKKYNFQTHQWERCD